MVCVYQIVLIVLLFFVLMLLLQNILFNSLVCQLYLVTSVRTTIFKPVISESFLSLLKYIGESGNTKFKLKANVVA